MASNHTVFRAYSALVSGLAIASGAIFGLMAFFIGADVFMRNVTGAGLSWVIELMEYAMYVATVFAAPWVLREGGHVSVDILRPCFLYVGAGQRARWRPCLAA